MRAGLLGALLAGAAASACLSSPDLLDVGAETRLSLSASTSSVPPRGAASFSASGGSREGYRFSIAQNASGGTIDAITGAYVAGGRGDVRDVVQVEDSAGGVAQATVSIGPAARVVPALWVMPPWVQAQFTASGGSGTGWTWELTQNESGGTLGAASGLYVSGPTVDRSDLVRVTDSLGNVGTARADVRWVHVWPRPVTLVAGASQTFQAVVLIGPNREVQWSVVEAGGGAISATTPPVESSYPTCTYVAPPLAGTYHVQATSVADPTRSGRAEVIVVDP